MASDGRKVFVGNLDPGVRPGDLERIFERYGRIEQTWVARNPPGFAFIVSDVGSVDRADTAKSPPSVLTDRLNRPTLAFGGGDYGLVSSLRHHFVGHFQLFAIMKISTTHELRRLVIRRRPTLEYLQTYCDSRDAKDAVESEDGRDFQGKRMRVEVSVSRNERGGRGRSMWERGGGPSRRSRSRSRDRRDRRSRSRSNSRREKRRSRYDRYRSRSRSSSGSRSGSESPSKSKSRPAADGDKDDRD